MSASVPASSCTSMSRSSAGSSRAGHRVTGDRSKRAQGRAGWQYLFVAIDDATRLAFARLYPDEIAASALAFLTDGVGLYDDTGSGSSACSQITAPASSDAGTTPAMSSRSASARPGPTGHRQTEKQNDPSAPCSSAGPTPTATQPKPSAPRHSQTRSTHTIATGHTPPAQGRRHSSASMTYLGRTPRAGLIVGCIHGNEPARIAITTASPISAHHLNSTSGSSQTPTRMALPRTPAATEGVDLNRNFPWRWQRLSVLFYSGRRPLSEPRSSGASPRWSACRPGSSSSCQRD